MITYNKLYRKICSYNNLELAFRRARKGKSRKIYVLNFEKNLETNLLNLKKELEDKAYSPDNLKKFSIRDPKTRTIHASIFRDRIVHHAIVNILNPIYQPIFNYDSFASQKEKGGHLAVKRFEYFMRKISNGQLIKNSINKNQIKGYVLKADFRKYFDTVDHEVLINILKKKIDDKDLIDLIRKVLVNFQKDVGMPLGNYTSQFFANVYLNELDYFIKHKLKVEYYIRYVDDFVILHKNKRVLEFYLASIKCFLPRLKISLHPNKTAITPLRNGLTFLGYRVFYNYKLLKKRNIRYFQKKLDLAISEYNSDLLSKQQLEGRINGWFGYAKQANTFSLRRRVLEYANRNIKEGKEKLFVTTN